ncbi:F-box protein [Arabidopsis thaliana]|uniref:F-box domain-containing protein n=2 Tax=Arabidopsis TaxID=3701 RepID=A0A178VDM9_ARATH|nr:F-box associated domain type 1 [Arabidopsis thaliana x Arabidopsis arenosa]OAP04329.1 hypothetical protein AXX17_AT3G21160 [Arabidopsis thaliana]
MTMMSDLTQDLVEEILSRVPITSLGAVRSTCKGWNALSKERILCIGEPKQQFLGFMMLDYRLCSMRFNLHGILNEDFVSISMYQVEISQVFYCAGLLLCVTREKSSRLVIWNPYLGQTRWINTKTTKTGYNTYALGCDNNKNHKILKVFCDDYQCYYEIYDVKSNSWSAFNVTDPNWHIDYDICASVNGNTYFLTKERILVEDSDEDEDEVETPEILICFDFTAERFGKFLHLPFQFDIDFGDTGGLSCVKEEKLAVLLKRYDQNVIEIWVTTKIEPNVVFWKPFLKVDIETVLGALLDFQLDSFFIDEEKKLAVVFSSNKSKCYKTAYIIGEDRYLKEVDLGECKPLRSPIVCFSLYVPSLVQINQIAVPKRRENKRKRKSKGKGREV